MTEGGRSVKQLLAQPLGLRKHKICALSTKSPIETIGRLTGAFARRGGQLAGRT